jgi:hypothetical protein
MKFSHTHNIDGSSIEMKLNEDADLDEVLTSFTDFLRAVGYVVSYDEELTFVGSYEREKMQYDAMVDDEEHMLHE